MAAALQDMLMFSNDANNDFKVFWGTAAHGCMILTRHTSASRLHECMYTVVLSCLQALEEFHWHGWLSVPLHVQTNASLQWALYAHVVEQDTRTPMRVCNAVGNMLRVMLRYDVPVLLCAVVCGGVSPGIPDTIADAAFFHLRAAGAFLVSGKRTRGHTVFVAVESVAGTPTFTLHVPPDWATKTVAASLSHVTVTPASTQGAVVVSGLLQGESVVLFASDARPAPADLVLVPSEGDSRFYNWWGLHPNGAGRPAK